MSKYIDAEKLMEDMADTDILDRQDIKEWTNRNAEDVRPVVYGKWNDISYPTSLSNNVCCSKCGELFDKFRYNIKSFIYCPNCGAKNGGAIR